MSTQQPNLKLQALSALLRDEARWPADFGPWNYSNWECCAIGLAYKAGITTNICHEFGMTSFDFNAVFSGLPAPGCALKDITPRMIAYRIDHYLAGRHEATIEVRHDWRMAFAVAS